MSEHEQSCPYDEDRWCGYTDAEVLAEMDTEALVEELRRRRDLNNLCTCGMCWPLGALWP